jgi:hypothetical protein
MADWVAFGFVATAVGSGATAVTVLMTRQQLKTGQWQAQTAFEDELEREYREILRDLPVEALLDASMESAVSEATLRAFYRYIDLTNQQVFLRSQGRISERTWKNWCDGIESNLRRPAFEAAWKQISETAAEDFQELRRLERSNFSDDPIDWP